MAKIILADDHQLFLQGVSAVLEEMPDMEIIATVNNGIDLIESIRKGEPDLVLLDLNMPRLDGLKCLLEIKSEKPQVKVLVLTNYSQPELIDEVKNLKADGFMIKNSTAFELKEAVTKILSGEPFFMSSPQTYILDETSYFFDDFLKKFKLTRREVDIIRLICQELSSKQIAAELNLSEFTVTTHRKNIQRKLNVKNVAGLVSFAREHQLVG